MFIRYIMKHRRAPLIRFLARKCARFIEHYENASNYDFDHNGELFVLEALAPHKFTCIFDVGANVGEWTLMAHDIFPEATIHCFEVMHSTFELLCKNTSHIEKIIRNDFGLLDKDSEVELKYFPAVNALTTLTDYPHNFPHQSAHGRVIPGDAYVAKCDASINFLKIDVEGVEGLVLAGFADTLMNHRVDVVQFEYGQGSILTKIMLRDLYAMLTARGYRVGKIYTNYVEFRDYNFRQEDFYGPNFLAVREDRPDLIDSLS